MQWEIMQLFQVIFVVKLFLVVIQMLYFLVNLNLLIIFDRIFYDLS